MYTEGINQDYAYVPTSETEQLLCKTVIELTVRRWPNEFPDGTPGPHCHVREYQGNGLFAIDVQQSPREFNIRTYLNDLKVISGVAWVEQRQRDGQDEIVAFWSLQDGHGGRGHEYPVLIV